ncbi:response regulator transcription factor [Flaviaesturariibacter amylovorans]|uniref:Response regulator n=1 Tax=Flaviaesturariibacter amylovorans TaxID=1084520 RepID=A0ABP8GF53_9BACT
METRDKQPSVLTADDHTIVRTGLHMLLQLRFGITHVFEASSCAGLLAGLRQHRPSHLIVDSIFTDGNSLELMPVLTGLFPEVRIMVYSMLPEDVYAPAFRKYGVRHYLHKGSAQDKIEAALAQFLLHAAPVDTPTAPPVESDNPFTQLSPRELEVLHYLLRGDAIGDTASALNLHKNTVSTMKSRIFEKTGATNLKELIDKASANQIHP